MPACCSWNDVFQYETNKVTRIQSMNYGTIKWICHLIVFSYVIFALVSDKRYQRKEPLISSVHTKVKGIAEVREEIIESGAKKVVQSVFDTADYTFPLQGNSFFVMTNFLKTEGQEQGLCPEVRRGPRVVGQVTRVPGGGTGQRKIMSRGYFHTYVMFWFPKTCH
uniref:Purinergic receptor P2X 7 n=1 Tax=Equus caballus TaxID=9796 RepID=A0A9L0S6L0_HORSE